MNPPNLPPPLPAKPKTNPLVYVAVVVGCLVFAAFFGGAVYALQSFKQKRANDRKAMEQIGNNVADLSKKMAESIERGDTAGGSDSVGRMQEQLEKSANLLSGDERTAALVIGDYLGQMKKKGLVYEAASARVLEASIFEFKSTDSEALAGHRKLLADFADANEQLAELVRNSEQTLRAALVKAKVAGPVVDANMQGFNRGRPSRALQTRIREYDRVIGESGIAVIDLLEKKRGAWTRDPASGGLLFNDDDTLATFNKLMDAIQEAGAEQGKVQKELAAALRKKAQR